METKFILGRPETLPTGKMARPIAAKTPWGYCIRIAQFERKICNDYTQEHGQDLEKPD
jgi:hypothetical protein